MSSFFQEVYKIVAQIPEGKVATYGQIAVMLGRAAGGGSKVVGWAMRSAPEHLNLPCHRVVNKTGTLAPGYAFGGQDKQRAMLEAEGITFTEDGRIQVEKHLWRPERSL